MWKYFKPSLTNTLRYDDREMLGIDHGVMVCHVHHRILIAIGGDNFNKNRPLKRIYSFHGFQFTSSVTSLFDKAFQDMNASG